MKKQKYKKNWTLTHIADEAGETECAVSWRGCLLDSGVDQNAVELGAAAASSSPAYSPMKQTRRSAQRARRGFRSLPVRTPPRRG